VKVLLVRLSAIGDIVHTMPTAVAIKRAHPDWQLDWVVQKEMGGLLSQHPAIDRVIEISRRPRRDELRALKGALRAEGYDVALDMQGLLKSGRIVGMSGAKKKLGYHWQREFSWVFSRRVRADEGIHVVEQYLAVAEAIGCPGHPVEFGLRPTPEALRWAEAELASLRLEGRPLAVNFGAGKPEKKWPLARWAELISLAERDGWAPIAIGAGQDAASYEEVKSTVGAPPASLIGKTTLEQLVAVLSLCEAHVGGDTGSTHISVALGKPVACMMGPTNPHRSGPYGREHDVLYKGEAGLAKISGEEVMAALAESDRLQGRFRR
jgi:heptosyltransferase-1